MDTDDEPAGEDKVGPYTFKSFPKSYQDKLGMLAINLQKTRSQMLMDLIDRELERQRGSAFARIPTTDTVDAQLPHHGGAVSIALEVMKIGAVRGNGTTASLARQVVTDVLEQALSPERLAQLRARRLRNLLPRPPRLPKLARPA